MPRTVPKAERYSQEQRTAVVDYKTAHPELSMAQVCELAATQGINELSPFEMNVNSAYAFKAREERRLQGREFKAKQNGTPLQRIEAEVERALRIVHAAHLKLDRKPNLTHKDAMLGVQLAKWLQSLKAAQRGQPTYTGGRQAAKAAQHQRPTSPDAESNGNTGLIRDMQRDIGNGQSGGAIASAQETIGQELDGDASMGTVASPVAT